MTIKLPEPKGYFAEWTEYGKDEEEWQCMTCLYYEFGENSEPFYTEAQLKQAIRDALEEAAKVCEFECSNWDNEKPLRFCADGIRKLKEQLT